MGIIKKAIKPMFKNDKWHIVRGDTVKILSGKDKNQVGTVLKVIRDERIPRVLVEGLNLVGIPTSYQAISLMPDNFKLLLLHLVLLSAALDL